MNLPTVYRRPRPTDPRQALRAAAAFVVEALEQRRLFSVSFADGVVHVVGTSHDDNIHVDVFYERQDGLDVTVARLAVNGRVQTFRGVIGVDVDGRGGQDTIAVRSRNLPPGATAVNTTLSGGAGDDTLVGDITNDLMIGGDGNDHLQSGTGGIDSLFGGAGNDMLYNEHRTVRNAYLCSGAGQDRVYSPWLGYDDYDHAEGGGRDYNDADPEVQGHDPYSGVLEPDGTFVITGSSGDDVLLLWVNDNQIGYMFLDQPFGSRYAGSSYLQQVQRVRVITGAGEDRVTAMPSGWNADLPVVVDAGAGDDQVITAGGDDTILSGSGHDLIDTGDGDDLIADLSSRDRLLTGAPAPRVDGGTLIIDGTDFNDRIIFDTLAPGEVGVWFNGTVYNFTGVAAIRVDGGAGDDVISRDENLLGGGLWLAEAPATLLGGAGDDTLLAGSRVSGVGSGDLIDGGDGNDWVGCWGAGGDKLLGGDGDDFLVAPGEQTLRYGGAGENLILINSFHAVAGDDGTGVIEAVDEVEWTPPAEYNSRVIEPLDLSPGEGEEELIDDGGGDDTPDPTPVDPVDDGDGAAPINGHADEVGAVMPPPPPSVTHMASSVGSGSFFSNAAAIAHPWDEDDAGLAAFA